MLMLAVVVLLGGGGWYLAHHGIAGREAGAGRNGAANPPQRSAPAPRVVWHPLQPASAQAFDPYGGGQGDNSQLAPLAIDHDPATAWHTEWYTTPRFGNLKPGTGLLLNMVASLSSRAPGSSSATLPAPASSCAPASAQPHLQDCRCEPGKPENACG